MSNLEEVSHEMLVLVLPRVSSRVSGFPVALWGKLQNLSFSKVSKQIVMSFCLAGAATCLITCRKSFCVAGAILLCRFHKMSCSFSWQAQPAFWRSQSSFCAATSISDVWHRMLYTPHSTFYTPHSTLNTLHSTL